MSQKIVVAFPLYRQIPSQWFLNWLQMEKDSIVGTVATDGIPVEIAMQTMVDMVFDKFDDDWDRLVVVEHDMILPLNAFTRIAQYGSEHDIVGSVYFKHDWPHHVMAWMQLVPPRFSPLTAEVVKAMVENPALYPVDGVAMGCTSIARHVLEDWDPDVPMWHPTPPLVGHDLHFCHEAKKQGFNVFLDSGIGCGHLTLLPIGYPHSQEALQQAQPATWQEAWDASGHEGPCNAPLLAQTAALSEM